MPCHLAQRRVRGLYEAAERALCGYVGGGWIGCTRICGPAGCHRDSRFEFVSCATERMPEVPTRRGEQNEREG
jgi:hypothetical protein